MPMDLFSGEQNDPVDLFAQQNISQNQNTAPAQSPLSQVGNAIYGAAAGAGKALGQDTVNALNIIPGMHLNPNVFGAPAGIASDIGGIAGHAAGAFLPGGLAGKLVPAATMATDVATKAIPMAERIWSEGLAGAGYGAATSPDGQRGEGALTGLFGAVAPGVALHAGIPTAGFIKNILTGTPNLSPEAKALQSQVGDLPVPYAAENLYKKVLGNVPLSGVGAQQAKVAAAAQQKANNIVDMLKGNQAEGSIAQNVADTIKANHKTATTANSALYQNVADQADNLGVKLNSAPNLSSTANSYLKNTDYPLDQKYKDLLSKYLPTPDMTAIGMGGGLKGGPLNFNEAHALQKQFANQAQSHYGNDNYLGKMYSDLSDSLKNDMELSAKNSSNPDLYNKLLTAKQDFSQNVAPYRNDAIYPIVSGDKNLNTLHNTLLQNTPAANKVVSDLPDDIKKQVAYLNFNKAAISENPANGDYTPNPQKLYNAYNKLDETQKGKLFSPDERQQFNALGTMANYSKSGSGHLSNLMGMAETIPALMEMSHGNLHGIAHSLGLAMAAAAPARAASVALTNPVLRRAYLSAPSASQNTNPFINNLLSKIGIGTQLQGLAG